LDYNRSYDRNADIVLATGNVAVKQETAMTCVSLKERWLVSPSVVPSHTRARASAGGGKLKKFASKAAVMEKNVFFSVTLPNQVASSKAMC